MKSRNAIVAALMFSNVGTLVAAADSDNILYSLDLNKGMVSAFAADSDNLLFSFEVPSAQEQAAAVLGVREIYVAPVGADGIVNVDDFILLSKLRAGDTGPTPEAVTEDTTFDNGNTVSNQTGVNNGSKTWDIEGSADEPAITMLIDHCRIPGFGTPEKRGKSFAYIAFNEDRSSFFGAAKVNTATSPREGSQRWSFNIPYETVGFRRPNQNPLAGSTGVPAAADITPDSGPVGTSVAVTGVNLNVVDEVRLGAQTVVAADFTAQTTGSLSFLVPVGATAGTKALTLIHDGNEVYAGDFTVTVAA
jgi:hypothetical protein